MFIARLETPSEKKYRMQVVRKEKDSNIVKATYGQESDSLKELATELHRHFLKNKDSEFEEILFESVGLDAKLKDAYDYIYGKDITGNKSVIPYGQLISKSQNQGSWV